jgi:hypothetical protein
VERDDVRNRIDLLRRGCGFDTELTEALLCDERVVSDDMHPEAERAIGDLAADASQPEDAEGLPRELDAREALAIPGARRQCRVRLRDVAGEGEEESDGMLGCGVHRRLCRVRDDDPTPRGGVDVDVVDPHSRAPDDLEPGRKVDEGGVDGRRGSDHDRVELADDRTEIGLGVLDDVETIAQERQPRIGDRFADEDARAIRHARRRGRPRAPEPSQPRARSRLHARRATSRPRSGPW